MKEVEASVLLTKTILKKISARNFQIFLYFVSKNMRKCSNEYFVSKKIEVLERFFV